MKILVIGQGAREHALAWKLAQSPLAGALYVAPGNAGTAALCTNVAIPVTAVDRLAQWAERERIDLTVVGPEAALAAGVVDAFRARGLAIFGPTRAAARLESSKAFAKAFMARHGIPTAAYEYCAAPASGSLAGGYPATATAYVETLRPDRFPLVIKADGLAAGKGVRIVENRAEALAAIRDLPSANQGGGLVVEEFLEGVEVSFLAIADGATARPLSCARDYKRAYDGDQGPMTGGMGAYSPVANEETLTGTAMSAIVEPAIAGMAAEGTPYAGILYAGLMITPAGPRVLEFNARFGDPETQVLLPRWQGDLLPVLLAVAEARLADLPPFSWSDGAACGVVLASAGYPEASAIGSRIEGLRAAAEHALVFHAATRLAESDGARVETAGGRVLTLVGQAATLDEARRRAYAAAGAVSFPGRWYRTDIADHQRGNQ